MHSEHCLTFSLCYWTSFAQQGLLPPKCNVNHPTLLDDMLCADIAKSLKCVVSVKTLEAAQVDDIRVIEMLNGRADHANIHLLDCVTRISYESV